MINSKWGAYQSCGLKSYDNVQLLKTASKVGEPLTYQINDNSREAFKERSSWQYTNTIGSASVSYTHLWCLNIPPRRSGAAFRSFGNIFYLFLIQPFD